MPGQRTGELTKGFGLCEGDGAMGCCEGLSNNDGAIVDGARGLKNVMMEIPKEVWSSVLFFHCCWRRLVSKVCSRSDSLKTTYDAGTI